RHHDPGPVLAEHRPGDTERASADRLSHERGGSKRSSPAAVDRGAHDVRPGLPGTSFEVLTSPRAVPDAAAGAAGRDQGLRRRAGPSVATDLLGGGIAVAAGFRESP